MLMYLRWSMQRCSSLDACDPRSHIMPAEPMDRDRAIDALVRFARLVSDAAASREILPLLADAIRDHVHADGVCVVEIAGSGGCRIAVERGLPPGAAAVPIDP